MPSFQEAQALADAGDLEAAERMLAQLIADDTATLEARILHARVLMRQERGGDALEAARATLDRSPFDARTAQLVGQLLLRLDVPDEALRHLNQAVAAIPRSAALKNLQGQALLMTGNAVGAVDAIDAAIALDPDIALFRAARVIALVAAGRLDQAREERGALEDGTAALLAILREWIFALVRARQRPLAISLCDGAAVLLPAQAGPFLWRAELLISESSHDDALSALRTSARANEPMTPEDTFRHARARGRALRGVRDTERAVAAFEEALALRPDDEASLRDLYVLHLQSGNHEAMRQCGLRLSQVGARSLPRTLAGGLAAFNGRKPPPNIWNERSRWAWELADKSVWTEDAWLERLHWGQNADALLRDWWLSAPERAHEIDALIDRAGETAIDRLPQGARCVVVTTHMGPLAAGVRYMQTCGRAFRGFGFAGPDPVVEGEAPMRISARGNTSFRELFKQIERGTLVGFAAESPESGHSLAFDFLGRPITLATFVPRIIHKLGTRSLWWHATWRGGRVAVELEHLPDPEEGENVEDWCRRWALAYLARIERVMRGAPENLNLGHGIWRNVD
jgi:tetratricopeptide (TPR) repeat protein